jgi:hypothetical protein
VRRNNSFNVQTRIFVSFVFDRANRGLLAKAPIPKEAGRIACDRNEEKECAALAAAAPKALGLYAARSLSYDGIEYEIVEHQLTAEQIRIYDCYTDAFQIIYRNLSAQLWLNSVARSRAGKERFAVGWGRNAEPGAKRPCRRPSRAGDLPEAPGGGKSRRPERVAMARGNHFPPPGQPGFASRNKMLVPRHPPRCCGPGGAIPLRLRPRDRREGRDRRG